MAPTVPVGMGPLSQRQRIIEAMIDSCAEKTYAATTITDLVSRARISRTTFYKRFADKRACLDATVDHCIELLCQAASGAHSDGDPPPEAVRRAVAAILELIAERPEVGQLLSADAVAVEPTIVRRYRRLAIPALEGLWDRAGSPRTRHMDPRLAFGRAQLLIFNQIAAGNAAKLPSLLPDIVYLAVAPFAGHAEALEQARLSEARASDMAPRP